MTSAIRARKPDAALLHLRILHAEGTATLLDDAEVTIFLADAGDRRASLAAAQLVTRVAQQQRLDMEGLDELMWLADGLPASGDELLRIVQGRP